MPNLLFVLEGGQLHSGTASGRADSHCTERESGPQYGYGEEEINPNALTAM
jgi:hypothetical protein